ncbi:hypothetical protein [Gorillibacterium massiliense]|uniref:hypothetical protein n=1 Tax=Gorillibacterium massiliense TaxID=1280390 RepID=UPI001EE38F16|nr:hypothetical protein [Gorillibacterium massiliense]
MDVLKRKGTGMRLSVDTSQTTMEDLLAYIVGNYRIADVTIEDPSMEEIITDIYSRGADKEV